MVIALSAAARGRFGNDYDDVRAVGRVDSPYAMPYESGLSIWLLRRPHAPLAEIWPRLRHYE